MILMCVVQCLWNGNFLSSLFRRIDQIWKRWGQTRETATRKLINKLDTVSSDISRLSIRFSWFFVLINFLLKINACDKFKFSLPLPLSLSPAHSVSLFHSLALFLVRYMYFLLIRRAFFRFLICTPFSFTEFWKIELFFRGWFAMINR